MRYQMMLLTLLLASSGCLSGESAKNNGWTIGEDTGYDVGGTDAAADGGSDDMGVDFGLPPGAKPLTFRMKNSGDTPVFASRGVAGSASCGGGIWLSVSEGGESRRISTDCTRCSCDATDCAVCAFDCAPGVDGESGQIGPQELREFVWDGVFRVDRESPEGGSCEVEQLPEGSLEAEFCWATSFERTSGPFGDLTGVKCETVAFNANDGVVEIEIAEPAPAPIEFVLRNTTDAPIYAAPDVAGWCSGGDVWLQLHEADGQAALRFVDSCGVCSCAAVNDASQCPEVCPGAACPAPTAEIFAVQPGEERRYQWNRVLHPTQMAGEMMCDIARFATDLLEASFCYGTSFDESAFAIADVQCERVAFDPLTETLVVSEVQ